MKKQKSSKKIVHKTNAMRILDKFKLQYECISYSDISAVSGRSVADALLENPNQVFKTLVAQGHSKKYYVFMIPVTKYLNLKSAAKITGEKSIDLIPQKKSPSFDRLRSRRMLSHRNEEGVSNIYR